MISYRMHVSWMHSMNIGVRLHMRLRSSNIRVLGLLMSSQVHLSLERSATELTSEWLEAGVFARMSDEV